MIIEGTVYVSTEELAAPNKSFITCGSGCRCIIMWLVTGNTVYTSACFSLAQVAPLLFPKEGG